MASQPTSTAQLTAVSTGRSLSDSLNIVQTISSRKKRRILNCQNQQKESPKPKQDVQENTDRVLVPETDTNGTEIEYKTETTGKDVDEFQTKRKYFNEMIPFIYNHGLGTNKLEARYENHDGSNLQDGEEIQKELSDGSSKILHEDKYMEKLRKLKRENEGIRKRKQDIISRYANLVYSYEYGLNSVRKLNDLRFAPDNILKGNDYLTEFEDDSNRD